MISDGEQYIRLSDTKLFYKQAGTGPALILIHGWGQNHRVFTHLMDHLARHFTVYAFDSRGHGKTGPGTKPLTILQMARDMQAALEALALRQVLVLGFSDGANIALQMAVICPQYLCRIVLISANVNFQGLKFGFRLYLKTLNQLFKISRRYREMIQLLLTGPQLGVAQLQTIRVPILLLVGDHDIVKPAHTRELRLLIPGARLKVITHTTHFTILRKWPEYIGLVSRFLCLRAG